VLPGNYAVQTDGKPSGKSAAQRVGCRVGAPSGADFPVDVGDVPLYRVRAKVQAAGYLPVRLPAATSRNISTSRQLGPRAAAEPGGRISQGRRPIRFTD
jgi:hypothetical protein